MVSLHIWLRRLLMLLIGVVITEFGSQLLVALRVGAEPFMILIQGISRQSGLSYGQTSTALMLLCFAAIFLLERNKHSSRNRFLHILFGASGRFLCMVIQPYSARMIGRFP